MMYSTVGRTSKTKPRIMMDNMHYSSEFEIGGKTWYAECLIVPNGEWVGKYWPGTYYEPPEYPEYELESIEIEDLVAFDEDNNAADEQTLAIIADIIKNDDNVADDMVEYIYDHAEDYE